MAAVKEHGPEAGIAPLCRALGVPRASAYRSWRSAESTSGLVRPVPVRALAPEERQQVLDTLHSERLVDHPPHQVYATLLDEGVYLCSVRTMYRVLASAGEVHERRDQACHTGRAKPGGLLDLGAWQSEMPFTQWEETLLEGEDEAAIRELRIRTQTGRPLASDSFMSKVEAFLGRRVRPLPVGRQHGWRKQQQNRR